MDLDFLLLFQFVLWFHGTEKSVVVPWNLLVHPSEKCVVTSWEKYPVLKNYKLHWFKSILLPQQSRTFRLNGALNGFPCNLFFCYEKK